jgi:hypothetical protein
MRLRSKLVFALALVILTLGSLACTSSSWCADCAQATPILSLNYQPSNAYTVGTAIPVNPPNPSGGIPSLYEVTAGTLPPGLNLNPATGQITGTPTAAGLYTLTIRGTNTSNSASQTIQITVAPALPLALSYATPQSFPAGTAIATQVPVLAQATPWLTTTYALTSGSLPPGLTLNADGTISGTPTTPGVYSFSVTVTSGAQTAVASADYTVTPADSLGVNYATPLTFTAGLAMATQTPTLANPTPGVLTTFALTAGSLPLGMGLNAATGDITGTPTTTGVYTFTVTATNGTRTATAPVTYTVNPQPPQGSYSSVVTNVNVPLTLTPQNLGGPVTSATLSSGPLPTGMTLNADGTISGTPTVSGVFPFTVQLCDGTSCMTTAPAVITVNAPGATPLDASYGNGSGVVGTPLSVAPAVISGGPVTGATVLSGSLPIGMLLNADGSITGTPTLAGSYTAFVILTNATGGQVTVPVTIVVSSSGSTPLVATYPASTGQVGSALTVAPTLSSGGPATGATLVGGVLPPGMNLNADGTITGIPTQAGSFIAQVQLCNATGGCTIQPARIDVNTVATPLVASYATTLGTVGSSLTVAPAIISGGPVTASALLSGSVPPGMAVNADGTITGTPTQPGTYSMELRLCNGAGGCTTQAVTIIVNAVVPAVSPLTVTELVGANNTLAPVNTGGAITSATVTAGGPLAAGLTLNADGTITQSGTTATGVYGPYTVNYCNSGGCASSTVTITINPVANLTVSYPTPKTFPIGLAIATQNPTLTNNNPGLSTTYVLTSGSLPAGLTLNANTGAISGMPTTSGVSTFTITATNGTRTSAVSNSVTYTVAVAAPTSLNYATPVTYTSGVAITPNSPNPAGGAPTAYSITSGSLPAGLSLDSTTGIISGAPTVSGTFSVTINGTNTAGGASQTVAITVLAYPTANLTSNPSTVPVGQSSSLTALFTGSADGTAVITGDGIATPLTVTSGTSVPTGIVNTSGTTRTYTLTVTNAQGHSATSQTTVQWVAVPADTWTVTIPTAGGGPLTPGSGNLLDGQISITVPNQGQSLCGDVTLTVNKETSLPGTIISSAQDYSHTFNIASNMGYPFRVPITITLAYDPTLATPNLTSADLPMAFYWDPSYSRWVSTGLKTVDTTAHTVTFTTLLPGRYAVLGIPGLALATQNLGFASGTDDWRQNNPSVYDLPGGAGLGMSSFASWYFPFEKVSNGGVGLYNQFPTVGDASAAALISRLANGTADSWNSLWTQNAYSLTDRQTGLALMTGLMVTGQPQVFLMADARPAVNNGLATAVYGYDNTAGKFKVMDPNFPGNALTITWSTGSGFSAYDRAQAYSPALTKFAFEGQTSIHRLADYDRVFSGASTGFPSGTFATIDVTNIGSVSSPDITQAVVVDSATNLTVSGTVTNGDETATYLYWSQNGSAPRVAVPLVGNTFTFTIPALADPYATTVALETTANPCDPTFSHSGYTQFVVKQSGLSPWFPNSCFENGVANPAPWTLQQGLNSGIYYPATPTFSSSTGLMNSYGVTWNTGSADSALVYSPTHAADANVPGIASVLDGSYSFRVNNPANGAHISKMFETITVPTTVADPKLTFYWAGAMQSAGHIPEQLPYVDILVQDVTTSYEVLYYVHHYPPSTVGSTTYTDGYPGWIAGNINGGTGEPYRWYGINWQKVSLNLGASRQGHQLKITVQAADCTQGGHGGYAYLDNIGCN